MLNYLVGDATDPNVQGTKIICHICNDIGAWGAGFVMALSRKWTNPEKAYRDWFKESDCYSGFPLKLGNLILVAADDSTENDIFIANMIGQEGTGFKDNSPPIRYEAVKECLLKLTAYAKALNATIHMPRIGCGLAGGDWSVIENIIQETLIDGGLDVFVYDLG